jgi:hypothetical protein
MFPLSSIFARALLGAQWSCAVMVGKPGAIAPGCG